MHEPTTTDDEAHNTVIVFLPGHANSGDILVESGGIHEPNGTYVPTVLELLRARGYVLVLNYPETDRFSFREQAQEVTRAIQECNPERLVLIGHSMGGRMATAIIDTLLDRNRRDLVKNTAFVAECALADDSDVANPLFKYWWAWRWPRFLNRAIVKLFVQSSRYYMVERGAREGTRRNWRAINHLPNRARRAQMRAIWKLGRLGLYVGLGVRVVYIQAQHDALVKPSAWGKYQRAFGAANCHLITSDTAVHCAHPEQPRLWNELLKEALDLLGIKAALED